MTGSQRSTTDGERATHNGPPFGRRWPLWRAWGTAVAGADPVVAVGDDEWDTSAEHAPHEKHGREALARTRLREVRGNMEVFRREQRRGAGPEEILGLAPASGTGAQSLLHRQVIDARRGTLWCGAFAAPCVPGPGHAWSKAEADCESGAQPCSFEARGGKRPRCSFGVDIFPGMERATVKWSSCWHYWWSCSSWG